MQRPVLPTHRLAETGAAQPQAGPLTSMITIKAVPHRHARRPMESKQSLTERDDSRLYKTDSFI